MDEFAGWLQRIELLLGIAMIPIIVCVYAYHWYKNRT